MLANVVAMWIKTFRTFGCGIWLAEQDLIRLTGGAASGDLSGHSIVGNSVGLLLMLNYGTSGKNATLDPERTLRAYVTQVYPDVPDLLLGKVYLALGPARRFMAYAPLERHNEA